MATLPQSDPTQGAAPNGPGPSPSPSPAPAQAPANPTQVILAQMYQLCKRLSQENPILSSGLSKAAEGVQEAQSAMVSQPSPQPTGATPPY